MGIGDADDLSRAKTDLTNVEAELRKQCPEHDVAKDVKIHVNGFQIEQLLSAIKGTLRRLSRYVDLKAHYSEASHAEEMVQTDASSRVDVAMQSAKTLKADRVVYSPNKGELYAIYREDEHILNACNFLITYAPFCAMYGWYEGGSHTYEGQTALKALMVVDSWMVPVGSNAKYLRALQARNPLREGTSVFDTVSAISMELQAPVMRTIGQKSAAILLSRGPASSKSAKAQRGDRSALAAVGSDSAPESSHALKIDPGARYAWTPLSQLRIRVVPGNTSVEEYMESVVGTGVKSKDSMKFSKKLLRSLASIAVKRTKCILIRRSEIKKDQCDGKGHWRIPTTLFHDKISGKWSTKKTLGHRTVGYKLRDALIAGKNGNLTRISVRTYEWVVSTPGTLTEYSPTEFVKQTQLMELLKYAEGGGVAHYSADP
jgi:hypothetical protein